MRQLASAVILAAGLAAALVLHAAPAAAQSPAWGELRTAEKLVSVHLKPDARSPLVRALNPGQTVKVDFQRPDGWCALFDPSEQQRDEAKATGYADCRQLSPAGKPAAKADAKAASATTPATTPATASAPAATKPAAAPAGGAGLLRQVEAKTEVRRERNLTSPVVAVLAAGEHIQTGFARDGFVAVFRMNDPASKESTAVGYIPEGMARPLSGPKPAPKADPRPAPEVKSEVRAAPAQAAQPAAKQGGGAGDQDPVRITSDRMVYSQSENAVVFAGNVHGTQADMAIWANKITAYFTEKARPGDAKGKAAQDRPKSPAGPAGAGDFGDKIERIVAEGNVRIVAGKNEGACGQLTYFVQEGLLRMDQNPILREGGNTVRGDVIKYYLKEQRSEVLGGAQRRVEAVFSSPKGEKK